MKKIQEESVEIIVSIQKIVDKKMPVFYNPVMKLNRDVSVLLLKALDRKDMKIGLPLAGSGVRGLRFLKELPPKIVKTVYFNDKKENYVKYMEKMFHLNAIKKKFEVFNEDASVFLIENKPFDYIDVDPFGTPNPFLDAACRALKNEGVLAVTATDTSALCGSYPKACRRKYWAEPLRNELMHEIGLRILIRKVQLMGVNHQRALFPIVSYSKDHYMRVFLIFNKSKRNMDEILGKHGYYLDKYGPMYLGELNDLKILKEIAKNDFPDEKTMKLINQLIEETKIGGFGFFDVHRIAKEFKGKYIPKFEVIMKALRKKKFKASRTHFSVTGIKTNANRKEFERIYKKLIFLARMK